MDSIQLPALIREAYDLIESDVEAAAGSEYLRGMAELGARLFPHAHVGTDQRAEEIRLAILRRGETKTYTVMENGESAELLARDRDALIADGTIYACDTCPFYHVATGHTMDDVLRGPLTRP